jgi:hypothetical protein
MSEVKIVLKRSPRDPENGVWIDGMKVPHVKDVTVYGTATELPMVVITLLPEQLTLGIDSPDIEMVPADEHKN